MKTPKTIRVVGLAVAFLALAAGCSRTTRSNPEEDEKRRAQTTTQGSAGTSEAFGDSRATKESTGVSPSESPTGLSKDAKAGESAPVVPQAPAEPTTPKK
jgi:hypothetical protein